MQQNLNHIFYLTKLASCDDKADLVLFFQVLGNETEEELSTCPNPSRGSEPSGHFLFAFPAEESINLWKPPIKTGTLC